jgi:hypothetical protein
VAILRTDVSEERVAFMTRLNGISKVAPNWLILFTLVMETICFSEESVQIRITRRHVPEDGILHIHRRENLKSYIYLTGWDLW